MPDKSVTKTLQKNKQNGVEVIARTGYTALGIVYCLMGGLTAMSAFGIEGGEKTNQHDTFLFLLRQPLGKVLLGLIAAGLLGYVFWQVIQVIKDPQNPDSGSAKGYGRRFGYALSAGFHATLALYAAKLALGQSTDKGGESGQQTLVSTALELPVGKWLVLLAAIATIGFALYQVYLAVSAKFMKYVQEGQLKSNTRQMYKRAGRVGYLARGIVFAVIGYFVAKAALNYNPEMAGGTENAFTFLESTSVPFLLAAVAVGFVCYGIFMFVRARHQTFSV